jgi:hypothetical protein
LSVSSGSRAPLATPNRLLLRLYVGVALALPSRVESQTTGGVKTFEYQGLAGGAPVAGVTTNDQWGCL